MTMKFMLAVFLVFTAVLAAPPEDVNGRIAGGDDVDIANYPYMLQLEYMDELICGATLISSNFALTAANCVVSRSIEYLLVRAGTTTLYEGGQELLVEEIVFHPQYDSWTNNYGIALLLLSENVSVDNAQPIAMAENDDAIVEGADLLVSGWGWEEFIYYADYATILQAIKLPILGDEACSSSYDIVSDVMFCAAYLEAEGRGFCFGDTGGPGVIDDVLVGVMSFGKGCGDGTNAGVLIRVSKVREWIESVIGATKI